MCQFVEFVKYSVRHVSEEEFLALRKSAIAAVKEAHRALVSVPVLAQQADGSWVDVWIYETQEAAEAAKEGAGEIAPFMAFAGVLEQVEIEAGHMPAGAASPL